MRSLKMCYQGVRKAVDASLGCDLSDILLLKDNFPRPIVRVKMQPVRLRLGQALSQRRCTDLFLGLNCTDKIGSLIAQLDRR